MHTRFDSSECKVSVVYRTDRSASDVIRELEYNDGLFAQTPESVIITETRRVRLEKKMPKTVDSEAA
jgi:hypothetical protein